MTVDDGTDSAAIERVLERREEEGEGERERRERGKEEDEC